MNNNLTPITERSNPKSKDIDILNAEDITRILSFCESEIFGGYGSFEGVLDKSIIEKCVTYAKKIREQINVHGKTNIILIGAGTSGRLCRLMAKVLNPIAGNEINIIPIIAGGIKALVRAEPNTEDRIEEGVFDYLSYTQDIDRSNCFVVGVSCGLSANYVKGALCEANKYTEEKTAIIGFNPVELATIDLNYDVNVFNPIIGPEPIVGSVRMKGGTTTMILIFALIKSSIQNSNQIEKSFIEILIDCKNTLSKIQHYDKEIAGLINSGNETLQSGGNIYLIGDCGYGTLCIYDAAECPPTFGAKIDQVNGYSPEGIKNLVYYTHEENAQMAKEIDMRIFERDILPSLTEKDMVVTIRNVQDSTEISGQIESLQPAKFFRVQVKQSTDSYVSNEEGNIIVYDEDWGNDFQKMLFIRTLLGQLSTGSFVLSGKVYENKMIDLRITNKKLFYRAIRIINDITNKGETLIEESLLKSIYDGNLPSHNNLEEHIALSATKENIVPMTILSLIYPSKSTKDLKAMLSNEPIIRKLVIEELANLQ
jgi:N-acetylmuramic acid 6-phosphate (MurNAc-6-P) etherase